ncbi:MAG TPA: ThiF family adenylyltransferase, partial [Pseudobdellovibrionaceae bacterium]|nr:ThiF family adenylyltransferase [Pseudobdellovibrionaceae bacterium]
MEQQTVTATDLVQPPETEYVLHRRFDRMGRLVGDQAMLKLFRTHVMVLGLGGVGSWAAESLVRSGVGKITIVDFDEVCITNANRQLHAL